KQFVMNEADVLRFLKVGGDGRFILNNTYTVRIRDDGGNAGPPPGASLLIVYRDVNNPSLSAIAIYGGGVQLNQANDRINQTLGGITQDTRSPGSPKGKLSLVFLYDQHNFF